MHNIRAPGNLDSMTLAENTVKSFCELDFLALSTGYKALHNEAARYSCAYTEHCKHPQVSFTPVE